MKNNFLQFIFLSCVIILVSSCAQVVPLSGGEKDITPPKVVSSSPKNSQTQFTGNKIELEFNEYIKLNNSSQLIISPRLKEQPEINVSGKKIEIKWKDNLEPNTTYRIYFGNAIADVTENNSLNDFDFIFSTGDKIDSATVNGKIIDAYSLKPIANGLVGLYTSKSDSFAFFEKAIYSSKTLSDGTFNLPFLRKGNYRLIAIEDNNKNELYDIGEKIAFLNETISVDSLQTYNLSAFSEESSKLFVKKNIQLQPEKFLILLNKKVENVNKILLKSKKKSELKDYKIYHHINSDSVFVYIKNPIVKDTFTLYMSGLNDSISFVLQSKEELQKQFERGRYPLEIKPIILEKNNFPYYSGFIATSNFSIEELDASRIIVFADDKQIDLNKKNIKTCNDSLYILIDWQELTTYKIYFYPGLVKDNFGRTNDTIQFHFKTTSNDDYGSLLISPKKKVGNKILQLINSKGNIVFEKPITDAEKIKIEHLLPDQYFIRIINDTNDDKIYSSGTLIKKTQPEKIYQYKESIKLLAGWENEIELPADFLNQ